MSEDTSNPYSSPQADPFTAPVPAQLSPVKRPNSPMVFGVLSLVFASFSLLGTVVGMAVIASGMQAESMQKMGYSANYFRWSYAITFLWIIYMFWMGISLIRYRNAGRIGFNIYAVLHIIMLVANTGYVLVFRRQPFTSGETPFDAMPGGEIFLIVSTLFGAAIGMIFPVLGLIFLNRQKVKEFLIANSAPREY